VDRTQLEDLYKILPGITSAALYRRGENGEYDPAQPFLASAVEQRPIDIKEEGLFEGVSGEVERCIWHVWVSSLTAPWQPTFSPTGVKIVRHWILKEKSGKEWVVVSSTIEMSRTRWRLVCIEYLGDPIINIVNAPGSGKNSSAPSTPVVVPPPPPVITDQPDDVTVDQGQTATFTVVETGGSSYQWFVDTGSGFVEIPGATSVSYTTPPLAVGDDGNQYRLVVNSSGGAVTSDPATLTVVPIAPPWINVHPNDQTAASGNTATFTVVATGAGPLSYQWQLDSGSGFANIVGATSASYTTPALVESEDAWYYRCVVSNVGGSTTSNPASLEVWAVFDHYITSQAELDSFGVGGTGESIGIRRGLSLVGQLNARGNVGAFGSGSPPVISAFKTATGPWTQNGTYPVVYQRDWDVSALTVDISRLNLIVNEQYITRVTSLALCASTPGSYYNDNVGLATDANNLREIYYHPAGSTNPNSDGRVVRITAFDHAIGLVGPYTITGIEADGNTHDNGTIFTTQQKNFAGESPLPQTLQRVLARRGTKHTVLIGSGEILDSVFHLHDKTTTEEPANGIVGVYENNVTGLSAEVRNSHIVSWEGATTRYPGAAQQGTMHSSDLSVYDSWKCYGSSMRGCNGDTWGGGLDASCDGLFFDRCSSVSPIANQSPTSVGDQCVMDRVLARHTLALSEISNGIVYGRTYSTWNNFCAAMAADSGATFPMFMFLQEAYWTFNNACLVSTTSGTGCVFFAGGGAGNREVTLNNSFLFTRGYRAAYTLTSIGGTRNLIITRDASPPTNVDNFNYTVNLWVNQTNVASKLSTLGLVTSGNAITDVYNFANACLLNGIAGASNGDFRLNPLVDNLQFGDGQYLGDHNVGAQSHWDYNAQAPASGPPSRWPVPPVSLADARAFISSPASWNFYP
jgi:hypothetical protein